MPTIESLEDFLGEEVVDVDGNPIGSFACHWECDAGTPVFLGVDLDDLSRRTHVVPAEGTRLSERQSYLKIPFTKQTVENAPCLDCGSELDAEVERKVYAHYGRAAVVGDGSRELRRVIHSNVSQPEESDTPIL